MSDRTSFYRKHLAMDDAAIRDRAPSVFAEGHAEGLSKRYTFIPTTQVLNILREDGWVPVFAGQSRARGEGGRDYMKHVLRFQRVDEKILKVGDCRPEIVVSNSHNGTSCFRFSAGLYRLICSNGLVVADSVIASQRLRHTGYRDEQVVAAANVMRSAMPEVVEQVAAMRAAKLSEKQRIDFAEGARLLRWDAGKAPVEAKDLLTPRRTDDNDPDLWTTMNVVQENLVHGGIQGRTGGRRPRRMTTREISSVNGNLSLNRQLWELAAETLVKVG